MKQFIYSIVGIVARLCGKQSTFMANADPDPKAQSGLIDHRKMLYQLLGLSDDAPEAMVNERYKSAMEVEPDEDDKKKADAINAKCEELKAANEKAAALETAMANEKKAKDELDAKQKQAEADLATAKQTIESATKSFANERAERVKLLLDAAVTANKITGAQRKEYEAEFANVATFDATVKKLSEAKGTSLPTQRQTGMANIGSRQKLMTPEAAKRRDTIATMVNEEGKKSIYRHLDDASRYSQAFTAVMAAHPELRSTETH